MHTRTLFLNDIDGYVNKVLELKVSLILRVHCSNIQGEVLWRSRRMKHTYMYMKIKRKCFSSRGTTQYFVRYTYLNQAIGKVPCPENYMYMK